LRTATGAFLLHRPPIGGLHRRSRGSGPLGPTSQKETMNCFSTLVVAEIAFALVLLVGAGLPIATQCWMLLGAALLGIFTFAGLTGPWLLLGLTLVISLGVALTGLSAPIYSL